MAATHHGLNEIESSQPNTQIRIVDALQYDLLVVLEKMSMSWNDLDESQESDVLH